MTDIKAMRKVVEAATSGKWDSYMDETVYSDQSFHRAYGIKCGATTVVEIAYDRDYHFPEGAVREEADATFIATFNPEAVTDLLDTIEALQARIAELEKQVRPENGLANAIRTINANAGVQTVGGKEG